jgi:hypothetical protein
MANKMSKTIVIKIAFLAPVEVLEEEVGNCSGLS